MSQPTTRKIFISYSWSSPEHQAAVIDLAQRLMADGVDVILDVWEVREGHDLISFMEKMVTDVSIQKVLIICDRGYAEKANDRKGGVGTESQIISPEVYQKVDQSKFIPVLFERDEGGPSCLPVFLRTRFYIDLSSLERRYENYEQLLRAIFDQPLHRKPKIGTPPGHLFTSAAAHPSTRYHLERVKDALANGKPQALALAREYSRRKTEELDSYRVDITHSAMPDFDELIIDSIRSMLPYRDEIVEFFVALVEYKNEPETYETIADFFQAALAYHFCPKDKSTWMPASADNFKFLTYELFLHLVAVLIGSRRFEEANQFLEREFFVSNPEGNDRFWGFSEIRPYLGSLEEHRNQRLKLNRISLTADLIKDRSSHKGIGFDELSEADLILYLRNYLVRTDERHRGVWYPYTLIYRDTGRSSPKLFRMSESRKHFANLKVMLGAAPHESGSDLLQRFLANGGQQQLTFSSRSWPISINEIINFNTLGARP